MARNVLLFILLLTFLFCGCSVSEEEYYKIPKSEIVDVPSETTNNNETIESNKNEDDKEETYEEKYFTYVNERFGFSVDIPDYLKPDATADNGDGIAFQTISGDVYLSVYGSNYPSVEYDSPNLDDIYVNELAELEYSPRYTNQSENYFEIAWEEYNTVYWTKYYLKSDGTNNVLTISYPLTEEQEYEGDIMHILSSFKTGIGYSSDVAE